MAADALVKAALALSDTVETLHFAAPVSHVYNPLTYAWEVHRAYLERYGQGRKRIVFLGMNPGPFGMAQTGVPFGEIAAVRDWLDLHGSIGQPVQSNPKRPVEGFPAAAPRPAASACGDCLRSVLARRRNSLPTTSWPITVRWCFSTRAAT
ncbi:hypothetical protein MASR1M42_15250 [Azonexus hydrophilus]